MVMLPSGACLGAPAAGEPRATSTLTPTSQQRTLRFLTSGPLAQESRYPRLHSAWAARPTASREVELGDGEGGVLAYAWRRYDRMPDLRAGELRHALIIEAGPAVQDQLKLDLAQGRGPSHRLGAPRTHLSVHGVEDSRCE